MLDISFKLYLVLLAFAPLAFGTVEHWSMMTVQALTSVALLLCLKGLKKEDEPVLAVPGLLPLLLFLGLMAVQLIPLPPGLVKVVSPSSWEAYEPVYRLSGENFWIPVTVNQKATLQELLRITTCVLFYILTIQLLRRGKWINQTLIFVAGLAAAIALVAVLQQFSSNGLIYWFRPAPGGQPGGPWGNINQYAAFTGAACPLVLALFLYYRPPSKPEKTWRERFVAFFSANKSNLHLFLGFAFLLLVFSVLVSRYRAGGVIIFLSLTLFALLYNYKNRNLGGASIWATLCLALLALSWFGLQPFVDEFEKAFDSSAAIRDARFLLWSDTLTMLRDYPLFGGGAGTYADIHPSYNTLLDNRVFEHARNDYLELLASGGLIGFGLAAWFFTSVAVHGWRKVMMRRDRQAVLIGMGALVAVAALLMHSTFAFNLRNGALGLYLFFCCGLLVAVVNHHYHSYRERSLLPVMAGRKNAVLLPATAIFVAFVCVCQSGVMIAGYRHAQVTHLSLSEDLEPELLSDVEATLKVSSMLDPLEGRYPFERGQVEIARRQPQEALDHALHAVRLQPMEGIYLQSLATMLPASEEQQASMLMEESYHRARDKIALLSGSVEWLMGMGQREQVIELVQKRLAQNPQLLESLLPLLAAHEFSQWEIEAMLPASVQSWLLYAENMEKSGDMGGADYFLSRALDFLDSEDEIKPEWFTRLIGYYQRQNMPFKAIETVRLGIEYLPGYAPFRGSLGDYYWQQGITFRAKEEYERALMLDPGNESYKSKLRKLELNADFGS